MSNIFTIVSVRMQKGNVLLLCNLRLIGTAARALKRATAFAGHAGKRVDIMCVSGHIKQLKQ